MITHHFLSLVSCHSKPDKQAVWMFHRRKKICQTGLKQQKGGLSLPRTSLNLYLEMVDSVVCPKWRPRHYALICTVQCMNCIRLFCQSTLIVPPPLYHKESCDSSQHLHVELLSFDSRNLTPVILPRKIFILQHRRET